MAAWNDISLVSYSDSGVLVEISPSDYPLRDSQKKRRTFSPQFLLVRSACFGVHGQNWRQILLGFMSAGLPCINTLESLYLCQEKPVIYGKLKEVQKRLGKACFPLIPATYYSDFTMMTFCDWYPTVVKVGTAHAGFGKMKIENADQMEDFRSVVALQDRYVTAEPFIKWDYDIRIQKIGDSYRAFRRYSTNWKGKGMSQNDEDIEVLDRYKLWIDEASAALGMDICALDAVHCEAEDKEYILELNDSAIGFINRHREEDLITTANLVLQRMEEIFVGTENLSQYQPDIDLKTAAPTIPFQPRTPEPVESPQKSGRDTILSFILQVGLGIIIALVMVLFF
eukprot:TRINITY_DN8068_c0_g1_i1.p1 TRINITY_DN8068_c0_g1~~TRINITY_DN8068_c0_g1_i1.p1  ORF type:complete len:380 (-),score=84.47 TRINITY_DN8068_c0_g1_i1:24-1043(-)